MGARHPSAMTLAALIRAFVVGWDRQKAMGFGSRALKIQ